MAALGDDTLAPPPEAAVAVEGLVKRFRGPGGVVTALNDLTARVTPRQVTGLIGPDAAGKTTLMRLAAGLLAPDAGRILVLGMDVAKQSLQVQAGIGYMPQRFGLYEDLTVQQNLDLYADLQGVTHESRPQRFEQLMRLANLTPFMNRLAGKLSGGMKQKLGLACTLVRPPRLLLLDEPTVGVDPLSRRELWDIIYHLVEDGASILLSTAYLDEAERCAEVLLLHQGSLLGQGPPGEFTGGMKGRCYTLSVPGGDKRALQERISRSPAVLDAVIQGSQVRLVLRKGADSAAAGDVLSGEEQQRLLRVEPRFEDAAVAAVKELEGTPPREDDQPPRERGSVLQPPRAAPAGATADEAAIEVDEVSKRFGDFRAVDGVSFRVKRGEIFGLLGPNGAGKSTTFRMLCGLLPPTSGNLRVAGVDLRRAAAAARAQIGYMSQKFALYGGLSVRQNLTFFASAYGLGGTTRDERIHWVLDEFGLREVADGVSADLPLGFKQRLAMGCALMHRPKIVFLDEPTSGVDPLARREFWRRINAMAGENVTVLVTTHFMEEAEYCDRLLIMYKGKSIALGSPEHLKEQAKTPQLAEPTLEQVFIKLIEQQAGDPR